MQNLITEHLDTWTTAHKTRSTVGRGSNNRLNLHGIKKLRELILELAVRGKLVPQDASDEPASELLKKVAAEKAKLVKEGKIKKEKPLPAISEDEKPFELPRGWSWVRFGELYELSYGDNLPEPKRSGTGEFSVFGSNGIVGTHDKYSVDKPCIVVGRKGSAGALNLCLDSGCWVTDVAYSVVPASSLNLHFVFNQFHTLGLDVLGKGIKPGLNRNEAYMLVVAIPPLAEQHRIVAKVDELMSFCDQIEKSQTDHIAAHAQLVETLLATLTSSCNHTELQNNWQRIAVHFDTLFTTEHSIEQLKKTILQLAVMGKLVPQDANDEPASELLKKIATEKARLVKEGKIKKEKPLPPIGEDEKPFELPRGWEGTRLGDVINVLNGRAYKKHEMLSEGTPLLRVGNLFTSSEWYYSNLELERDKYIDNGDLIYAWSASFGPFIWGGGKVIYHYHIWKMDFFSPDNMDKYYFRNYLEAISAAIKASGNGIAMIHMTKERMEKLVLPIPPLAEQHRIVAKVDELMILCDTLKMNLQNAQNIQLQLADALVEEALN